MTARDAKDSGINITGETVQAKNLVLDSASDISLATGKNTVDVKDTYKSSGWSVGAGISLTGGAFSILMRVVIWLAKMAIPIKKVMYQRRLEQHN
ncbi:MAG: hemagglutinin repeat-containing protein [Veillonella atypica]|uniref:hemagglutinin repeat-containing protein n=1 Tax=Veillonella TaxID=29465 RepID=UPI00290E440C|nr:hemagglutinin repeat-containing protein [Veillonella sp.]MDU7716306.1 hemagglutinin repeat-containing protein [Veillonella sp.]